MPITAAPRSGCGLGWCEVEGTPWGRVIQRHDGALHRPGGSVEDEARMFPICASNRAIRGGKATWTKIAAALTSD
jgi:hypothetical protein